MTNSDEQRVRAERTGWRDGELSERHRKWGWDCPAIDIDFLMIEYDVGKPMAIVEYKNECAEEINEKHPSYRALIELARRGAIPLFVCRYASDFSWWQVTALDEKHGKKRLPKTAMMTEREYVEFLYVLRGRELPDDLPFDDNGRLITAAKPQE